MNNNAGDVVDCFCRHYADALKDIRRRYAREHGGSTEWYESIMLPHGRCIDVSADAGMYAVARFMYLFADLLKERPPTYFYLKRMDDAHHAHTRDTEVLANRQRRNEYIGVLAKHLSEKGGVNMVTGRQIALCIERDDRLVRAFVFGMEDALPEVIERL